VQRLAGSSLRNDAACHYPLEFSRCSVVDYRFASGFSRGRSRRGGSDRRDGSRLGSSRRGSLRRGSLRRGSSRRGSERRGSSRRGSSFRPSRQSFGRKVPREPGDSRFSSPKMTRPFDGRFRTAVGQSVAAGCWPAGTPSTQIRHIPGGGLWPSGMPRLFPCASAMAGIRRTAKPTNVDASDTLIITSSSCQSDVD
jgi:hypothetical protein